ncbi:MAG: OmpA family protein [Deltaproteobacteria bacterium]|nr:OmpA family protein [Deltaproteobacteria bacterium]
MIHLVSLFAAFNFNRIATLTSSLGALAVFSIAMVQPATAQSPSVTDFSNVEAEIIEPGDIVEALAVPRGTKVRVGSRPRVRLPVYFEFSSADLKPEAETLLQKVGKALTASDLEAFSFSIEGHTDNLGDENFNAELSKRRADAVRSFLERAGVAPERLRAVGRGESDPADSNATRAGRERNRRVEIINLGADS